MTKLLHLYDSYSRKKIVLDAKPMSIYCCGPTVYAPCHLGHARVYLAMDIIVRFLRYCQINVVYVSNITDIDDKILARAEVMNTTYDALAEAMIIQTNKDFHDLNLLPPDHQPRATSYLPEIIHMIEQLLVKGVAYVEEGDVYFSIESFPLYGALSGQLIQQSGKSRELISTLHKKHKRDFVLWKKAKAGEPSFSSPFGEGRPGWHIECSAMGSALLGSSITIHAGGMDLMFPHHENELAQSYCYHDSKPVKCWLHFGLVKFQGQKMSKSIGNIVNLQELLQDFSSNALRLLVLMHSYRSSISFTWDKITQAEQAYKRLISALTSFTPTNKLNYDILAEVEHIMLDDFQFPRLAGLLFKYVKLLEVKKNLSTDPALSSIAITLLSVLRAIGFTA